MLVKQRPLQAFGSAFEDWLLINDLPVVITGGPCTGKSSTIRDFESTGLPVAHEEAARLIKEGTPSLEHNFWEFQVELARRQMQAEHALTTGNRHTVADRGVYDNIAYCLLKGEVPRFFRELPHARYQLAFLMEPLGIWVDDGVRKEDLAFTQVITPLFERAYEERGVPVIRVPAFSTDETESRTMRKNFILSQVEVQLGIKLLAA
jgi:predicted ATPase